eukprot:GHVS01072297.1.p1 GENE.GHVS01072297.1~~GHVS01072297.1.p1  ORF type:complete len:177 (-),score=32.08 GHVS01072297.1:577-1044(-)
MQAPTSLVEEEDVVYVYYCECTDVDEDDAMRRCADEILSEEEKQKASKFVRIEDKRMALMSRLMQRQLLSRHSHIPPEQIQIERNKSGTKPIWVVASYTCADSLCAHIRLIRADVRINLHTSNVDGSKEDFVVRIFILSPRTDIPIKLLFSLHSL